mmetsp:Transcript_8280/g.23823  ORF Transcript_8280/g.23823 Transcript_8280/m.23823 type:complete len:243 (-) Transcript_8280:554-1282(-)
MPIPPRTSKRTRSSSSTRRVPMRLGTTPPPRSVSSRWCPSRWIPCNRRSTSTSRPRADRPKMPCQSCTHLPRSSARKSATSGTSPPASVTGRTRAGTPSRSTSVSPPTVVVCVSTPSTRTSPRCRRVCTLRNARPGKKSSSARKSKRSSQSKRRKSARRSSANWPTRPAWSAADWLMLKMITMLMMLRMKVRGSFLLLRLQLPPPRMMATTTPIESQKRTTMSQHVNVNVCAKNDERSANAR